MVRVNYPPGGAAKIEEEVAREPKTVRVLKPPGGGSSICFTDDHNQQGQKTPSNEAASTPPQETPPAASEDSSPTTRTASEGKEAISTEIPSSANSTNGTTTKEPPTESPAEPPSPKSDPPQQPSNSGLSNDNSTEAVSCNGADATSPTIVSQIDEQNAQAQHEVIVQEVATTCVKESKEATSITSNESHQITTQISSNDHVEAVEKNISVVATEEIQVQPQQNGTSTANGEKYSSDSSRPSQVKSTPPPPCTQNSQSKAGQDDAQPAVTPNPTAHPRKIKDHMRSNIFMSDEDYTPTRSSRMNAAVVTESPTVAAAGQRQRIPPGGFSTKLW